MDQLLVISIICLPVIVLAGLRWQHLRSSRRQQETQIHILDKYRSGKIFSPMEDEPSPGQDSDQQDKAA